MREAAVVVVVVVVVDGCLVSSEVQRANCL